MRVLRSKHQVIAAGEELHNCAASYALDVEQKRLVLTWWFCAIQMDEL
jgi:hypothetical protein